MNLRINQILLTRGDFHNVQNWPIKHKLVIQPYNKTTNIDTMATNNDETILDKKLFIIIKTLSSGL